MYQKIGIKVTQSYSPNFNPIKRLKKNIKFIIIHYTGMKTETAAIERLQNPKFKVSSHFYIKKSVRKILRLLKKYARYSNSKETEVELLIYYCYKLKTLKPSISNNLTLTKIFLKQIENIEKKIIKLHEDLQFDFRERLKQLHK